MHLKIVLLLGCVILQGYAKPVEVEDDQEEAKNVVEEGVAELILIIDEVLAKADDIKTSELRGFAASLLEKTSEFDIVLDSLLLAVSEGAYYGRRIPDITIRQPKGSVETRLQKEDKFLASLFDSLANFKMTMEKIVLRYDPDGDAKEAVQYLRVFKQINWGMRQIGLALHTVADNAETDAVEELLLEEMAIEEKELEELEAIVTDAKSGDEKRESEKTRRDLEGEETEKTRKRRNWSLKLDGVHWNRGNHNFKIGPTFGRGGFGGGATYTWRFK